MRFFCTDIHGRRKAFEQVLQRSNFDYDNDLLIFGGDIVDRGDDPFGCIAEMNKIRNKVLIRGNHDMNMHDYIITGHDSFMGNHGSSITKACWREASREMKQEMVDFFEAQIPFVTDEENNFFTHGGFDRERPVEDQMEHVFCWDRELFESAMSCSEGQKLKTVDGFKMIFLGHTPTIIWDTDKPILKGGVYNADTGAGFAEGRLSIVNIDTFEIFQSDRISEL